MSAQNIADVFASAEVVYKERQMQATWGHLAPVRNKKYRGRIVYAVGCYCGTPVILHCEFKDLPDSPWLYEHVQNFMFAQEGEEGCVYEFVGFFRNYEFEGTVRVIQDTNKRGA